MASASLKSIPVPACVRRIDFIEVRCEDVWVKHLFEVLCERCIAVNAEALQSLGTLWAEHLGNFLDLCSYLLSVLR